MPLDVSDLRAIESQLALAKQLVEDALTIAEVAGDPGAVRTLKALLIRVSDTEANIAGRIKGGQP